MGCVVGLVCTVLVTRPPDCAASLACHHAGAVKKVRPCRHAIPRSAPPRYMVAEIEGLLMGTCGFR